MSDQQHSSLLRGELVRLTASNPDADTELIAGWFQDSEFARLLDSAVARPLTIQSIREELDEEPKPFGFPFVIRTLAEDKLIGFVGLWAENWTHGDAWLGIGIGERDYWGKGYGADALRIALHYAFTELNLHRVSLSVFAYNTRAIRAYEKVGFVVEGRMRQLLYRDGERWDEVVMGALKEEWENAMPHL
ncbi:MAG: GNAT family N-acetyltransferase [Chloroflexi bacterium]|nr:GNAT family N-acetyltransferase [Chloroflexota bacterium]